MLQFYNSETIGTAKCRLCGDVAINDVETAYADVINKVCSRCGYDYISYNANELLSYRKSELINRLLRIMKIQIPWRVQGYTEKKIVRFCKRRFTKNQVISEIMKLENGVRTGDTIWDCLYHAYDYKTAKKETKKSVRKFIRLTAEQQKYFLAEHLEYFTPEKLEDFSPEQLISINEQLKDERKYNNYKTTFVKTEIVDGIKYFKYKCVKKRKRIM